MPTTPLKAIHAFCLSCMGNTPQSSAQVRECASTSCPLHDYRLGRGPKREGPAREAPTCNKCGTDHWPMNRCPKWLDERPTMGRQ